MKENTFCRREVKDSPAAAGKRQDSNPHRRSYCCCCCCCWYYGLVSVVLPWSGHTYANKTCASGFLAVEKGIQPQTAAGYAGPDFLPSPRERAHAPRSATSHTPHSRDTPPHQQVSIVRASELQKRPLCHARATVPLYLLSTSRQGSGATSYGSPSPVLVKHLPNLAFDWS